MRAAVAKYPPGSKVSWVQVAKEVGNGQSNKDCALHMYMVKLNEVRETTVWTKEGSGTIVRVISSAEENILLINRVN